MSDSQLVLKANLTLALTLRHNPKLNPNPYCNPCPNPNPNTNLTLTLTSSKELKWGRVDCHPTDPVCLSLFSTDLYFFASDNSHYSGLLNFIY